MLIASIFIDCDRCKRNSQCLVFRFVPQPVSHISISGMSIVMPLPILEFHKDVLPLQGRARDFAILLIPAVYRSADCACWGLSSRFCSGCLQFSHSLVFPLGALCFKQIVCNLLLHVSVSELQDILSVLCASCCNVQLLVGMYVKSPGVTL